MKDWFYDQMAMYTAYHRNPKNRATHFVGVPLIVFALLVVMSVIPFGSIAGLPLTLATLFLAALMALYLATIPVGLVATAVHLPLLWLAHMSASGETSATWVIASVCFIGGWVIQFIGHIFEGRRPALFNNLLQVFMAPGFLVAEALFSTGAMGALKENLLARSRKYDPASEANN